MSNSIVLQNVRIIDPSRNLDEVGTIIVENGVILAAVMQLRRGLRYGIAPALSPCPVLSTLASMSASPAANIARPSLRRAVRLRPAALPPSS